MKKSILIVCLIIIMTVGLLLGCTRVSLDAENGFTTTRNYDFTDFTSIEIGYAFELEVIPADTYSISINASESTFDRIEVTKTGNKLEIGMDTLFLLSPVSQSENNHARAAGSLSLRSQRRQRHGIQVLQ